MLVGWTLYQVPRHYLIALKKYRKAIFVDVAIIVLTAIFFIVIDQEDHIVISIAGAMFGVSIIALLFNHKNSRANLKISSYEIIGLEFGMVNFLSGGVSLSLIPLAKYFEGAELAGVVSIFLSISAVALLIPRAISLSQLPCLSMKIKRDETIAALARGMSRQILISNAVTTLLNVGVATCVLLIRPQSLSIISSSIILALLIVQSWFSTQALVNSNILMAVESSKVMLFINSVASVFFFSLVLVLYLMPVDNALIWLCLGMVACTIYRLHQTQKGANKYLCQ